MKHINFIPSELAPKTEVPGILIPAGFALVLCLYMGGTVLSNIITVRQKQAEINRIETETAALAVKIDGLSGSAVKDRLKVEDAMLGMKKILAKKNYWSGIFREMSVLMPEGVWLTGFGDQKDERSEGTNRKAAAVVKAKTNTLLIKGESSSQELIAQFLISLEKSHHFAGVQLISSERETDVRPGRYKFQFSIPITTAVNGSG